METKIISLLNHKGGVGKTTTVASLGAALESKGYSVLLVDLDAQASLTSSLLTEEPEVTIYDTLIAGEKLPIVKVKEHLDIVPASTEMISIELELIEKPGRETLLKQALEQARKEYQFILLDCPPNLGLVTLNALVSSTDAIIPLTAEALPTKGVQKIEETIQAVRKSLNRDLQLSGILITRYERSKLSSTVEDYLRSAYGSRVYETRIRKNVALAEAPLTVENILDYAPGSNGAKDYLSLAEEILKK